jgi:hypothetical protein
MGCLSRRLLIIASNSSRFSTFLPVSSLGSSTGVQVSADQTCDGLNHCKKCAPGRKPSFTLDAFSLNTGPLICDYSNRQRKYCVSRSSWAFLKCSDSKGQSSQRRSDVRCSSYHTKHSLVLPLPNSLNTSRNSVVMVQPVLIRNAMMLARAWCLSGYRKILTLRQNFLDQI